MWLSLPDPPLQKPAHDFKSALGVMTPSKCFFKNLTLLPCLRQTDLFFPDTQMFTDLSCTLLKQKELPVYRGRSGTGMTVHSPPNKVLAVAMLHPERVDLFTQPYLAWVSEELAETPDAVGARVK